MKKPRVLIVFARHAAENSTRFNGFVKRIQKNGGFRYAEFDVVALEDLVFCIRDAKTATITDIERGIDVANYAFVYFKSWQSMPELAASLALYLEAMGIPYEDTQARNESISKTSTHMTLWKQGLPVVPSLWGSRRALLAYIEQKDFSLPAVIKSIRGEKGRDNFLVSSRSEARAVLQSSSVDMILQPFIENDGDYRIGVYGCKSRWGIYRSRSPQGHLNNTSMGGTATLLEIDCVDPSILRLAEQAAAACELAVSGVDIMTDKRTGQPYILEANQGSQIVTGVFTESNMQAFDEGMRSMVQRRYTRNEHRHRPVIGRTVIISINEIGDFPLIAKVDTGAYQSSMHAENIKTDSDADGPYIEYDVQVSWRGSAKLVHMKSRDYGRATIKNSFGIEEQRYVVPMTITILGMDYPTRVSLSNRSLQKYPVLLGRKILRGNFLVNAELSANESSLV